MAAEAARTVSQPHFFLLRVGPIPIKRPARRSESAKGQWRATDAQGYAWPSQNAIARGTTSAPRNRSINANQRRARAYPAAHIPAQRAARAKKWAPSL